MKRTITTSWKGLKLSSKVVRLWLLVAALLLIFIMILFIPLVLRGSSKTVLYKAGTYEGSADGHIGPIKVKISTDEYKIKAIEIVEQEETPVLADIVCKEIPAKVIKANSADVEVVAGATYSSKGLIEAIRDGLKKAAVKAP